MPPAREQNWQDLMKAIGPGILVACAAVGGSHLFWSTRAGALYGWGLVGLVLLSNLLKFPFFLYGQRYTAATGESLLGGYRRHGRVYVWIFLAINILTGTVNIAGVAMLSGALFGGYGWENLSVPHATSAIILLCMAMVLLGHYRFLDAAAKAVMIVLALTTFLALALAAWRGGVAQPGFRGPDFWTWQTFAFVVLLMGWMPAPIDLSAWSSLWMFSRREQTGHFATTRETTIDFHLGYAMAVVLALAFLALGKLIMYGSGQELSSSAIVFSGQLVSLYSANIGDWARPLILSAAFFTMFSTTLTCVDGYPRSLAASCTLVGRQTRIEPERFHLYHRLWVVASTIGAILIVQFYVKNLLHMLSFAAIVSFLTSPVIAFINFKVMTGPNVPADQQPGPALRLLSWAGMLFFLGMALGYAYVKLAAS